MKNRDILPIAARLPFWLIFCFGGCGREELTVEAGFDGGKSLLEKGILVFGKNAQKSE